MSNRGKTILGVAVCLVFAAALAAYFVIIPNLEREQANNVAAFIAELPGDLKAESITVSLFEHKVTVKGLKGDTTYLDGSDMTVDVESIVLTGVNLSAAGKPGMVDLVDEAIIAGGALKIVTPMPPLGPGMEGLEGLPGADKPIVQNLTFKDCVFKGLRGDYEGLRKAVRDKAGQKAFFERLADFSVASFSASSYSNKIDTLIGPMSMQLDSFTARDMSLLTCGPASFEKFTLSMLGSDVMRMDRMTMASYRIPNIYGPLLEARESGRMEEFSERFFEHLDAEGFIMRGLTMEKLYVKFFMPEALTVEKFETDLEFAKGRLGLRQDFAGLVIPASLYRHLGLEASQFAEFYDKPLDVTAGFDLALHWKPGRADLAVKRLAVADKNLASASLTADSYMTGEGEDLPTLIQADAAPYLVRADLALEDKALLANIFGGEFEAIKAFGLTGEGMESAADLRAQAVLMLESVADTAPSPELKTVVKGLVQLVRAPGRLTISLHPETPVSLDLNDGAPLNAKVEYTPAQ